MSLEVCIAITASYCVVAYFLWLGEFNNLLWLLTLPFQLIWKIFCILAGAALPDEVPAHPATCLCEPCRDAFTKAEDALLAGQYASQLRAEFEAEARKLVKRGWVDKHGPVQLTPVKSVPDASGVRLVAKGMCECGRKCGHANAVGPMEARRYPMPHHPISCTCGGCR